MLIPERHRELVKFERRAVTVRVIKHGASLGLETMIDGSQ